MKIKICPKCGSRDIEEISKDEFSGMFWHYAGKNKYKCKKCSFVSLTFPEIDERDVDKFRKKL